MVCNWDALEQLWQHLFSCTLGMQPEGLAVLVANAPTSPHTTREKVAEILFECFHMLAMQTVHQALLALYAYGRTTGLVLGSPTWRPSSLGIWPHWTPTVGCGWCQPHQIPDSAVASKWPLTTHG